MGDGISASVKAAMNLSLSITSLWFRTDPIHNSAYQSTGTLDYHSVSVNIVIARRANIELETQFKFC
jgi:hypothetical protein